jgi:phage tail sheath gpL-like
MTAAPQYWNVAWNQPDAPESQSNLAVRLAGYMASLDYVALNMDRVLVRTLGQAPLLIPAVGSRPDPDTRNADMLSLGISPIVVFSDNQNHVDSAKTTIIRATASDVRTCELSCIRSALYQRAYINAAVDQLLFTDDGGKNFRADGEVHTPYVVTADQVTQCIINALRELSNRDVIQNVEANKDLVQFSAEPGDPTVINYFIPFDPVVPLHIFNYKQALV